MRGDHHAYTKVRCGMRYKSETDSYIRADDTLMLFIIIIIIISFSFEGRVRESGPAGRTTSLSDGGGGSIVAVQL